MKTIFKIFLSVLVLLPGNLLANRPQLSNEQTYDSDHFKIHYTTDASSADIVEERDVYPQNGIPDVVDNLSGYLEYIYYSQFHDTIPGHLALLPWGLNTPPPDGTEGGDEKYDIYIKNLSVAGVCQAESLSDATSYAMTSYICLNNNNSSYLMYITIIHEYMHAVQTGYGDMPDWFQEATANWSANNILNIGTLEMVYELEKDFNKTDVAINYQDSELDGRYEGHDYAMWLFIQYLTEQTDNSIIRNLYERVAQMPARTGRTRIGMVVHGEMTELIDQELQENWNSSLDEMMTKYAVANLIMDENDIFQPYNYSQASTIKQYVLDYVEPVFENTTPLHFSGTDITWNSQTDGNGRLMRLSYDCLELTADENFKISINPVPDPDSATLVVVKAKKERYVYGFASEWVTTDAEVVISKSGEIIVDDNADWTHIYPMVVRVGQNVEAADTSLNYELHFTEYTPSANSYTLTCNVHDNTGAVLNYAVLTINESEYSSSSGSISVKNLENGTYSYSLEANGFVTYKDSATINGKNDTIDIYMPANAKIAVRYGDYWYENGEFAYADVFDAKDIAEETDSSTLYVYNKGDVALTISDISLSGMFAGDFAIISQPEEPIAPGDSAALKMFFDPSVVGIEGGVVTITSNDPDAGEFVFLVDGEGLSVAVPYVMGNGQYIPAGKKDYSESDWTYYGIVDTAQYAERTFTIKNIGSDTLWNCKVELDRREDLFKVTNQPETTILPGDSSTFTVWFSPDYLSTDICRVYVRGTYIDPTLYGYYFLIGGKGTTENVATLVFEGNGKEITNYDETPSKDDDTFFGTIDVSSGYIDKKFTIKNTGNSVLSVYSPGGTPQILSLDGTNSYFSFVTAPASQIAAGSSSSFTVRYQPTSTGTNNARVYLLYNTVDRIHYFDIQGIATDGSEILVEGNRNEISNGDDTPEEADNTDFGMAEIVNGAIEKTFIIKNTGTGNLALDTPEISGKNCSDFSIITAPADTVASGDSTSFSVSFTPEFTGKKSAIITIKNSDADEQKYTFSIQGTGVLKNIPEAIVLGNSIEIESGDTTTSKSNDTHFGNSLISNKGVVKTFTIKNTGTTNLLISNPYIANDTSGSFSIESQPAAVIAPNGLTTISVRFAAAAEGSYTATLVIPNNDPDESIYSFSIEAGAYSECYSLTFNIRNSTDPIENAIVSFDGSSYTSDINGQVFIENLINTDYNYTVSATGYITTTGVVTISDADMTENISMVIKSYSVNFYDWDGTELKTETVDYGNSATAPSKPNREGFSFTGWDIEFDSITCSLNVTAQYSINIYYVTFKDFDGTVLKTDSVEYGDSATAPFDPIREGYIFIGWDVDFENVTANLIVTAMYQATTSIAQTPFEQISVYPNPVSDKLYFNIRTISDITIINNLGMVLYRDSYLEPGQTINVRDYKPGIYFVIIDGTVCKIIKK